MARLHVLDEEYANSSFSELLIKMPTVAVVDYPHWQPTRPGAARDGYWRARIQLADGRFVRLVIRNTNWLPDGANRVSGVPSAPWPLATLIEEANRV